jgi:type IV pilus assembly protein PilW
MRAFKPGRCSSRERGLTLVELLIAMTIALFLLAGLLTIVQGLKSTWKTQGDLARLQDGERLAMTMLTDVVQTAGYYPDPTANDAETVFPAGTTFTAAGQTIVGTSTAGGPDTITVQYAVGPGDKIINCEGGTNAASAPYVVYVNKFSVNADHQLQCELNGGDAVPLVSGVENMVILYGVDTGGGTSCVDKYLSAAEVSAAGDWLNVCSVKIQLTFTNPTNSAKPVQFSRVIAVMSLTGANT